MKIPITINRLEDIYDNYDAFILDQWGVMHDGNKGYAHAIRCVKKLYQHKNDIIIISNSSKRKMSAVKKLPKLGFDPEYFVEVMTREYKTKTGIALSAYRIAVGDGVHRVNNS